MSDEYRFKIDGGYTPATLPMERLAEYMADLAQLLGEGEGVHFRAIEDGSAVLVSDVDQPAAPKVRDRVRAVRDGNGPKDAWQAFLKLDEKLRMDNAAGELQRSQGAVVLTFPGRTRAEPVPYGPFRQDGTIDGQVFRLGGKDETIHVHVRDAGKENTSLETSIALAQEIRHHILGPTLRFRGSGLWYRSGAGYWELRKFRIDSFEILNEAPLSDVIASLREVKGNRWSEVPEVLGALSGDGSGGGTH